MRHRIRYLAQAGVIAAVYAVLTHMQNFILPDSSTWAIQFRVSEALCVLALLTPAAAPGLAVGCMVFNLTYLGALPADFLIGSLASFLAAQAMWWLRRCKVGKLPLPALLMPAIFNGLLIGGELAVYIGGGFGLNALYVAIGEAAVLLTLGSALFYAIRTRGLANRIFR